MSPETPWWRGARGEWYVVAQGILMLLIAIGPRGAPGFSAWAEPWRAATTWVGVLLMILGGVLAVWGLVALGSRNLTALPYPKEGSELVETGPYAIVRNPIYGGLIIGALGWALWLHAWLTLVFAVGLFVLFDFKSRREERWLCERYPAYAAYQARVKKLLPWLY